jgi:hypothetical protein
MASKLVYYFYYNALTINTIVHTYNMKLNSYYKIYFVNLL